MTILGVQLVITLVMVTMFQRLSQYVSFARWFLCSHLVRFLHPTDEELKQAAGMTGQPKGQKGARRRNNHNTNTDHSPETFTIQKSVDVPLECGPLQPVDMLPVRFYPEYQWMLDVSICALVVYILTEFYITWIPSASKEVNLSMVWCFLVLFFALKLMLSLTAIYFRLEDHGEKILCLLFGFFFLVLSMGVLITTDDLLDLGLDEAHENFSKNARGFLDEQGIHSHGPASVSTFKMVLAFISSLIGAFITFPGLRLARMHTDALRYAVGQPMKIMLLYINFLTPVMLTLMWVKPAVKDHLTRPSAFPKPIILTEDDFNTFRLWCVVLFCLFRFCVTIPHLQAHLNMAYDRAINLKREAGRISNIEYKKMITHVFYYICVVALQYLTPLILLLFFTLCLKTLGGLTWTGFLKIHYPEPKVTSTSFSGNHTTDAAGTVAYVTMSLTRLRGVFTVTWYRGIFNYLSWWVLVTWSVTSLFGLVYHAYFKA